MSLYDERPWLRQYPSGQPGEIEREHDSMLDAFKATVERMPDRPALIYFDREISFRELDEITDALASGLQAHGFKPGDRLAVYLQNVPQFAMGMVAAWKAGGILVTVNPMLRQKELTTLLADSGAVALLTLESLWSQVGREVVPNVDVKTVITTSELDFVDGTPALLSSSSRQRDDDTLDLVELVEAHRGRTPSSSQLGPDDIAFLVYTSGTTGPPKGAMNSHGNVVFNAQAYRDWIGLDDSDVVLGVAPLFHITGLVGHIAVGLLVGMPLVLSYRFDADDALELIERHRVTFTVGSITVFIALMNAPTAGDRDVSSLAKVVSGGAPIAPPTVEAFEKRMGAYIHNIYGLTETTSPSHCVPIGKRAPVDAGSGALSVGVPIFNTVVRLVDDDGNEVAPGEVGEIVTSGPQVVSGYWNKPEETEHAFPGGALHTGDVGVMDADGWFYIVDRKKDMINAAGYKVWPREVEDGLYAHEAVREAAVVGVPDEYRGETVKAFVSLNPGASVDEATLIAFCKERMAAYKYPREIVFLDELPKTASGKILRRELRDTEAARTNG
ncbi:MAG: long-chain acyl-CoA synthetase [Solirubrobacteraceae bacterium]|jgi:long-chain acyl-CoA synthetase|nr:long-chain acyl-CoA synthetase [Solirubrobacteraceae bacterium]